MEPVANTQPYPLFSLSPSLPWKLVLVPRYSSLEMFIAGDAASIARKETFERYRCAQQARPVIKGPTPEACANLLTSMSAIIHQGALREC